VYAAARLLFAVISAAAPHLRSYRGNLFIARYWDFGLRLV
jgi:hypothetical protein